MRCCMITVNRILILTLILTTFIVSDALCTEGIPPEVEWIRTYNSSSIDKAQSVLQTVDGGYIITGTRQLDTGRSIDVLLLKTDSKGNEQWNRTLKKNELCGNLLINRTPDGGFMINGSNATSTWLMKTDIYGTIQWINTSNEITYSGSKTIQQTFDGGYIKGVSTTFPNGIFHTNVLIIKTDAQGNKQWSRIFGGNGHEFLSSVWQVSDGGYMLGIRTLSFSGGFWLIKLDPLGNIQWDRIFEGVKQVQQTSDDGCTLIGEHLIKIDSNGNEQWKQTFENYQMDSLQQTRDGGYIIAGDKDSDLWLIKLEKLKPIPCALFTYVPVYPGIDQQIKFDATASYVPGGNITNYIWDFGDGNAINTSEEIIMHSYASKDNYVVNLTVTGNNDTIGSTYKEIRVQQILQPQEIWNKTFAGHGYEKAYSIRQTSDGGYIIAGETETIGNGNCGIWLVKTDAYGNMQWNKTFQGTKYHGGYYVQQTSDEGYIIAASTRSSDSVDSDLWLIKTDPAGNKQWDRTFGRTGYNEVGSMQLTSDGGYILAGETYSHAYEFEIWLIKIDSTGNKQWDRTFGGIDFGSANSLEQTSDGGYIIAGEKGYDYGKCDFWLIKTDQAGNEQWNNTYGKQYDNRAESVQQTLDGGYIIAGYTFDNGKSYILLVKTDSKGKKQWIETFGRDDYSKANCIRQTSDGGYIIAGETGSKSGATDAWLVKTDSKGNMQWEETFGGSGDDTAECVIVSLDDGYVIAGDRESYGLQSTDLWVIKLGNISAESDEDMQSDEEQTHTEKQPEQTGLPGFSAVSACASILFVVIKILHKRK
jgi:hypothetical protein